MYISYKVKGRATSRKVESWARLSSPIARTASARSNPQLRLGIGTGAPSAPRQEVMAMGTEENEHVVRCAGSGRSVPAPAQEEPNQRQRVNCIPQYSASGTTTV